MLKATRWIAPATGMMPKNARPKNIKCRSTNDSNYASCGKQRLLESMFELTRPRFHKQNNSVKSKKLPFFPPSFREVIFHNQTRTKTKPLSFSLCMKQEPYKNPPTNPTNPLTITHQGLIKPFNPTF